MSFKMFVRWTPVVRSSLRKVWLSTAAPSIDERGTLDRLSHNDFLRSRDWNVASQFWSDVVRSSSDTIPFITGDKEFGVTNLTDLNEAGMRGEFFSKDLRYSKKRTFAIRVGYVGTLYNGYQRQTNALGVHTVEDDLKVAVGNFAYGAGRTDASVSAISQVVSLVGNIDDTAELLLERMRASEPIMSGRLAVYGCVRVPKKFNARSSATWRRYLYMLPLNEGTCPGGVDIDIEFLGKALKRLEDLELPYNGFAHSEDRTGGEGLRDLCTLYRARATRIDLNSTDITGPKPSTESTPLNTEYRFDSDDSFAIPHKPTSSAVCIELVGSRFLRKMVRILVATAARESILPIEHRNENILVDICQAGDRSMAAAALPGKALCFAGVGYDSLDLALMKFMSKKSMKLISDQNDAMVNSGAYRRFPTLGSPSSPSADT